MATFYLRSGVTNLAQMGSYSTTSGGVADVGYIPGSADDIIIDENSGVSRTLTGTVTYGSLRMTGSAYMVFNGYVTLTGQSLISNYINGQFVSLTLGACRLNTILAASSSAYVNNLNVTGSPVGSSGSCSWRLGSNLTVTNHTLIYGDGASSTLRLAGYKLVTGTLRIDTVNDGYVATLDSEGGVVEISGVAAPSPYPQALLVNQNSYINIGNGVLKFTDKSSSVKLAGVSSSSGSQPSSDWLGNVVNDTGNAEGTGGLRWAGAYYFQPKSYDCGYGAINIFPANSTVYCASWIMNGNGRITAIRSDSPGQRAVLQTMVNGTIVAATVNANFCSFKDIAGSSFGPVTTFRALNSVNLGNNLDVVYVKPSSHFFTFF